MAETVTLYIDSVDQTARLIVNTLQVNMRLEQRTTAKFRLKEEGPQPYSYEPPFGEDVEIYQGSTKVFAGVVKDVSDNEPVKDSIKFMDVECVSYDELLDRFNVAKIYDGYKAGEVVKDILDNYLPDESIGQTGIQDGLEIERAVFAYRKASDCIREIADLIGFSWYIDVDKDLQFFDRATFNAPWSISDGSSNYISLGVKVHGKDYRNKQLVRGGNDRTTSRTENFTGDDEGQTFTLGYPCAEEPTITLDTGGGAASQTVGIRGVDDPADFDWYWKSESSEITQKDADTPISPGDVLAVTYRGYYPIITQRTDAAQIAERAAVEGGSGIYENVATDRSIESGEFAEQKAEGLLRRFGSEVPVTVNIVTDNDGLMPGQLLFIDLPDRHSSLDAQQFLIDSVTWQEVVFDGTHSTFRYRVKALSGEHLGGWARFFRKLQDAGRVFNLREGETLQLLNASTEGIEVTETYTQADALFNANTDEYTGWRWGYAWWNKSFWGAPDQ